MFIAVHINDIKAPRPHIVRSEIIIGQSRFQTMRLLALMDKDLRDYKIIQIEDDEE